MGHREGVCERLEEVVLRHLPDYETGTVLRLRKTLYSLWQSLLLWRKEATKTFKIAGFKGLPQDYMSYSTKA